MTPASFGSDLTSADYAALESRCIDPGLARRARLRRVDSLTGAEIIRRKGGNYSGILIPYFDPGSDQVRDYYRLRRDQPDLKYDSFGNLKTRQKYLSPPGRSNMLYVPPGVSQALLRDLLPVVITEGEFKTLGLWRAANHGTLGRPRFLPVRVSGVYNWRGTVGKAVGPAPV